METEMFDGNNYSKLETSIINIPSYFGIKSN